MDEKQPKLEEQPKREEQAISVFLNGVTEFAAVPFSEEKKEFLIMASLKAPYYEETKRAPIDLVTVIDRSGSMGGEKISLVHQTLKFVVKQLKNHDRLAIVSYDNEIEVPLPLTEMNSHGKQIALDAIKNITARGATNLCGGLLKGLELIEKRTKSNDVTAILLFTDGLTNCGLQKLDDIIHAMCDPKWGREAQKNAENDPPLQYQQQPQIQMRFGVQVPNQQFNLVPITPTQSQSQSQTQTQTQTQTQSNWVYKGPSIHTFGFGSDHSADLLKAIADKANGVYFFVENPDKIPDAFADCLGGLLSVVAQNLNLTFQAVENVEITKVLTKFRTTEEKPKKRITVTIGDIQSEEEKDILAQINLPALSSAQTNVPIVKLNLTYFNVLTSKQEDKELTLTLNRPETVSDAEKMTNFALDRQRNRIIAADALVEAKQNGDAGKYAEARQVLEAAINKIKSSISAKDEFVQTLLENLNTAKEAVKDPAQYSTYGTYAINAYSSAHHQQRATSTTPSYQTTYRKAMKQSFQTFQNNQN